MKRSRIILIAVIMAVIGMTAMVFLKPDISPSLLSITGTVKGISAHEKVTFLDLDPENFTVVYFGDDFIQTGRHTLHGRLQRYDGRVEFVVDSYD